MIWVNDLRKDQLIFQGTLTSCSLFPIADVLLANTSAAMFLRRGFQFILKYDKASGKFSQKKWRMTFTHQPCIPQTVEISQNSSGLSLPK